jgi:hypothetical protein
MIQLPINPWGKGTVPLATRQQIVNLTNLGKLTQAEIVETFHVCSQNNEILS